jgi:hypothetical protein
MTRPSHVPISDHPSNVLWVVRITTLHFM